MCSGSGQIQRRPENSEGGREFGDHTLFPSNPIVQKNTLKLQVLEEKLSMNLLQKNVTEDSGQQKRKKNRTRSNRQDNQKCLIKRNTILHMGIFGNINAMNQDRG